MQGVSTIDFGVRFHSVFVTYFQSVAPLTHSTHYHLIVFGFRQCCETALEYIPEIFIVVIKIF